MLYLHKNKTRPQTFLSAYQYRLPIFTLKVIHRLKIAKCHKVLAHWGFEFMWCTETCWRSMPRSIPQPWVQYMLLWAIHVTPKNIFTPIKISMSLYGYTYLYFIVEGVLDGILWKLVYVYYNIPNELFKSLSEI